MNAISGLFANFNNAWVKIQGVALKVIGLAGVLSGASQLLLEVAKALQDKSAPELLALVKAAASGQDPAVIAIGLGLAALGIHSHLTNIIDATNMPDPSSMPVAPSAPAPVPKPTPAPAPGPNPAQVQALSAVDAAKKALADAQAAFDALPK